MAHRGYMRCIFEALHRVWQIHAPIFKFRRDLPISDSHFLLTSRRLSLPVPLLASRRPARLDNHEGGSDLPNASVGRSGCIAGRYHRIEPLLRDVELQS